MSVLPGWWVSVPRGRGCYQRRTAPGGFSIPETPPPKMATAAAGTHPTGMHSSIIM